MKNGYQQKRMAVINDFTGFGRCSLTVEIPIISTMGIECCPLPTSILSNHTAFPGYFFDDYTEKMKPYMKEWENLGIGFDGILTGFMGSTEQIELMLQFIRTFRSREKRQALVIVDPIMGDSGKPYATYTAAMCEEMKKLAAYADILTPNLTECCILTDTPYQETGWCREALFHMAEKLCEKGAKKVIVSGIRMGQYLGNVIAEQGKETKLLRSKRVGSERCGTGDIFSSILAADAVNGVELEKSVRKAMKFIQQCILLTEKYEIPKTNGVCFEYLLKKL